MHGEVSGDDFTPWDIDNDRKIKVSIVKDTPCPLCGAQWGHEDKALDFPNRPKVETDEGWWWRCYNPKCPAEYYLPETGTVRFKDGRKETKEEWKTWAMEVVKELALEPEKAFLPSEKLKERPYAEVKLKVAKGIIRHSEEGPTFGTKERVVTSGVLAATTVDERDIMWDDYQTDPVGLVEYHVNEKRIWIIDDRMVLTMLLPEEY